MPTPLDAVMNGAKPAVTISDLERSTTMQVPRVELQVQTSPSTPKSPEPSKPQEPVIKVSEVTPSFDFEKKDEPKIDATDSTVSNEPIIEEPVKGTVEENLKAMRKVINENKTLLKAKEAEVEEVKIKLSRYEKGEIFPEVIQEKENEIARLTKFEKLHSLKTSKEYNEAFIKPLNVLTEKVTAIAKDYEIPPEVIKDALKITNRADLNKFLSNHFDEIGALEVKGLLNDIKTIQTRASEAEAEPQKVMTELQAQFQQIEGQRKKEKLGVIANTSRRAWSDSLTKIKDEGQVHELIFDDGDTDHNENYVKPILNQAAQEYGKLVTMLAEAGLENLPEPLAYALARMSQLAHASAVSVQSREAAVNRANALEKNTARTNGYHRPSMNGVGGGTSTNSSVLSSEKPLDGKQAASEILNKIMPRR